MGSVIVRANTERAVTVYEHPLRNANVNTVLERTVVHELVHQWSANPGPYSDHCHPYVAYNSTAAYPPIGSLAAPPAGVEFCLMSHANDAVAAVPTMPAPWDASVIINMVQYFYANGLTHFHVPSTGNALHSEYLVIRNTSDPWHP